MVPGDSMSAYVPVPIGSRFCHHRGVNDSRGDARQRPLCFHWVVNTGFVLVVTLPFEFEWGVVAFAAVMALPLVLLTRRWERRASRHP